MGIWSSLFSLELVKVVKATAALTNPKSLAQEKIYTDVVVSW